MASSIRTCASTGLAQAQAMNFKTASPDMVNQISRVLSANKAALNSGVSQRICQRKAPHDVSRTDVQRGVYPEKRQIEMARLDHVQKIPDKLN
jgi:hypothetical protein